MSNNIIINRIPPQRKTNDNNPTIISCEDPNLNKNLLKRGGKNSRMQKVKDAANRVAINSARGNTRENTKN